MEKKLWFNPEVYEDTGVPVDAAQLPIDYDHALRLLLKNQAFIIEKMGTLINYLPGSASNSNECHERAKQTRDYVKRFFDAGVDMPS